MFSVKKNFLKILQFLEENTCAKASFEKEYLYQIKTPTQVLSCETFRTPFRTKFLEHFRTTASVKIKLRNKATKSHFSEGGVRLL